MRTPLYMLAAAMAVTGCTAADPDASVNTVLRPTTGERDGDNGGPEFFADELINVMEGNGLKNSPDHQRYERKARAIVGVPPGPIVDPMDQELVGATIGSLTNTTGVSVHVHLRAVAFGDHPNGWQREDRVSMFEWRGGSDIEAFYAIGDDVAHGVRDQRRSDSYKGRDIGAFVNAGVPAADISKYQQNDQAYAYVTPASRTYEETSILVTLADPSDGDMWLCLETGDCKVPEGCAGAWALVHGELLCMEGCSLGAIARTEGEAYCDLTEEQPTEEQPPAGELESVFTK